MGILLNRLLAEQLKLNYSYVCVGDTVTVLLLRILCSFLLFHFSTKICTLFSSLETSVIDLKLWSSVQNGVSLWTITFFGNLRCFTGVLRSSDISRTHQQCTVVARQWCVIITANTLAWLHVCCSCTMLLSGDNIVSFTSRNFPRPWCDELHKHFPVSYSTFNCHCHSQYFTTFICGDLISR